VGKNQNQVKAKITIVALTSLASTANAVQLVGGGVSHNRASVGIINAHIPGTATEEVSGDYGAYGRFVVTSDGTTVELHSVVDTASVDVDRTYTWAVTDGWVNWGLVEDAWPSGDPYAWLWTWQNPVLVDTNQFVPDAGSSAALLGLGFAGLAIGRRNADQSRQSSRSA
jgi:hypothetical protein